VVVAVLAVGASACGDDSSTSEAQTRTVHVDWTSDKMNAAFLLYFPKQVTVRPGDTIDFKAEWTGEPHTVTMGTMVDAGMKAVEAIPPDQRQGEPPEAYAKLPTLISEDPIAFNQNAAQPCFLATGEPPSDPKTPCGTAQQQQPEFNGKQTYFNSGFLPKDATFTVKLATDTAPGTYSFYCNIHGPDMSGKVVVQAEDTEIPSASEVDAAAAKERDDLVGKMQPAYDKAKQGDFGVPGVKNVAGFASQDPALMAMLVDEFIPAEIQAKVNEKVTWTVVGPHTVTFGKAPFEPGQYYSKAPDGAWLIKDGAFAPTGFPAPPPPPSGPPPANAPDFIPLDGGTFDGSGYKSTGFLAGFGAPNPQPSLTFTKAGTYSYVCLLHPKMGGIVKVT
jgi:plastocyanin